MIQSIENANTANDVQQSSCSCHRRRISQRRGNLSVLSGLSMVILLGLVAFAVDIGYLTLARTEFQGIADSCALAAVSRLPSEADAQSAAMAMETAHEGPTGSPVLATDVEFGTWDRDTLTLDPHAVGPPNAVRVTVECSAARGNPLKLFFADIFHRPLGDVRASATAIYDRLLGGPFIGVDWLTLDGVTTDSWNSEEGDYNSSIASARGSVRQRWTDHNQIQSAG